MLWPKKTETKNLLFVVIFCNGNYKKFSNIYINSVRSKPGAPQVTIFDLRGKEKLGRRGAEPLLNLALLPVGPGSVVAVDESTAFSWPVCDLCGSERLERSPEDRYGGRGLA